MILKHGILRWYPQGETFNFQLDGNWNNYKIGIIAANNQFLCPFFLSFGDLLISDAYNLVELIAYQQTEYNLQRGITTQDTAYNINIAAITDSGLQLEPNSTGKYRKTLTYDSVAALGLSYNNGSVDELPNGYYFLKAKIFYNNTYIYFISELIRVCEEVVLYPEFNEDYDNDFNT